MNAKPRVEFGRFIGWVDHPGGSVQARLGDVRGHPLLDNEMIAKTSAVVRIEYGGELGPVEIETLNTIYFRAETGREHGA